MKARSLPDAGLRVLWCPEGRYLALRPSFTLDPDFHAGAYYVQEASSMLLHYFWQQLLGDNKAMRVLDLCAAPGGKSTLIASLLDAESLLISNDVIRSRATILEENITRWGYANTWVTSNDPRDFGRISGYFDAMIVDAPCSGSGLFRKDAHALNEWSENNVALCNARQQRILADAWPSLKEGGLLFYATCSYSPEEDEQVLDWLGDNYEVVSEERVIPEAWGVVKVSSPRHGFTGYRCFPNLVQGEGFFIAVIRKTEVAQPFFYPRFRSAANKKAQEAAGRLLAREPFVAAENDRKLFTAIRPWHEPDLALLQEVVYLRKAGVLLGEDAHKDWIPAHDIALSIDRNLSIPTVALSREQALRFLKKEDAGWPTLSKGWHIVTHDGLGLGWIKALTSRVNNYLPRHWRIRMELDDENGT